MPRGYGHGGSARPRPPGYAYPWGAAAAAAEGALCLWADLGAARRAHRCGTVEARLTSCAGEWHRYVGGLGLGEP